MKSKNRFVECGKYSEVMVLGSNLIFKTNDEYASADFNYINESFDINDLQDSTAYKTYGILDSFDIFIKYEEKIYFIHKNDFNDSENDIYFVAYNLEKEIFHEISLKEILVDNNNKIRYVGNFSTISICKDGITMYYKSYVDDIAFEIKKNYLNIDVLADNAEYYVADKNGEKDCIKKIDDVIYFYHVDSSISLKEGIVNLSYNIKTKSTFKYIEGESMKTINLFDNVCI